MTEPQQFDYESAVRNIGDQLKQIVERALDYEIEQAVQKAFTRTYLSPRANDYVVAAYVEVGGEYNTQIDISLNDCLAREIKDNQRHPEDWETGPGRLIPWMEAWLEKLKQSKPAP